MSKKNNRPAALYIHVPFCHSICYYCDFCHVVYRRELVSQWLSAIQKELTERNVSRALKTIYIGGGTPSVLSFSELRELLESLDGYRNEVLEYTIEVNPESISEEKIQLMKDHGINRVSIGMQTGDDVMLAEIGRKHTFADTERTVSLFRKYGIDNLSLDLMYGLPRQDLIMLQKSVKAALDLDVPHLSLYSLSIPENTLFGKRGVSAADEDLEADMYEWIVKTLKENGYRHYEISSFAKEGMLSRHNLVYWRYEDFYGIGAGASGKENHARYDHTGSLKKYLEDPCALDLIPLSRNDEMFEHVMMSLRLDSGMDLLDFEQRYQCSFAEVYGKQVQEYVDENDLIYENQHIRCTEKGMEILNTILTDLL